MKLKILGLFIVIATLTSYSFFKESVNNKYSESDKLDYHNVQAEIKNDDSIAIESMPVPDSNSKYYAEDLPVPDVNENIEAVDLH